MGDPNSIQFDQEGFTVQNPGCFRDFSEGIRLIGLILWALLGYGPDQFYDAYKYMMYLSGLRYWDYCEVFLMY